MISANEMIMGGNFDERSPLEQLRLSELRKLAAKNNIGYNPFATKGELLRLLNGVVLIDNSNAPYAKQYNPPSDEAIAKAREDIRNSLLALDAVEFVAWCKEEGITTSGTIPNKANREKIIDQFLGDE